MLDKIFRSSKDNKNVNESLIKDEADAKKFTKTKCNKSNLMYSKSSFYSNSDNEKFDRLF